MSWVRITAEGNLLQKDQEIDQLRQTLQQAVDEIRVLQEEVKEYPTTFIDHWQDERQKEEIRNLREQKRYFENIFVENQKLCESEAQNQQRQAEQHKFDMQKQARL